jgi:hypothetical protein
MRRFRRAKLRLSRGFPAGPARQRHPTDSRSVNHSVDELWGMTSHARATREAPVRTEPHPHQSQNKTASQMTRKTIGIKTGALTPRN